MQPKVSSLLVALFTSSVQYDSKFSVNGLETVNREHLGTRLSCFGSEKKMAQQSPKYFTRFTGTYCLKSARRQLDGPHLLLGVYLQTSTELLSPKFPDDDALSI